ncbi:DNA-deoxyinosine glycosylase [Mucilaginibacter gynuensis]
MKTAFLPIVNRESTILILGTMPGERSLRLQQYYGHAGNHFWKIMFALLQVLFTTDYSVKTRLLLDHHIALWDVLQNCECIGSADSNIKNEVPNDFEAFHKQYPNIKRVFFASTAAEQFYNKHALKQTGITYHRLPSPSGANTWKTFDEKLDEWKVILQYL